MLHITELEAKNHQGRDHHNKVRRGKKSRIAVKSWGGWRLFETRRSSKKSELGEEKILARRASPGEKTYLKGCRSERRKKRRMKAEPSIAWEKTLEDQVPHHWANSAKRRFVGAAGGEEGSFSMPPLRYRWFAGEGGEGGGGRRNRRFAGKKVTRERP